MTASSSPQQDAPAVEAEIARIRRKLNQQAVMAIAGMAAIVAFLTIYPSDHARTMAGLAAILPWFLGLTVLILAANRWTLSVQTRAARERHGQANGS